MRQGDYGLGADTANARPMRNTTPGADFEDGELDFQLLQTCFAAIKFPVRRARKRVKLFVETGTRPGERPMP